MRMYNEIYRRGRLDERSREVISRLAAGTAELRRSVITSHGRKGLTFTFGGNNEVTVGYGHMNITDSNSHSIEHCKTHAALAIRLRMD